MSRRGDNIWHRKDGRWEARYVKDRINGRAVYGYVYGKTYTEAKEKQVSTKHLNKYILLTFNYTQYVLWRFHC